MKDKGEIVQKKSAGSKGASGAKRNGAGGARRGRTACPSGSSEQQTAQIEARFRAVFESSRDAIGVSKAGIHVFVNPAYLDLFGFPRGTDLAGKPVLDLIAPESRGRIEAYIRRRVEGEEVPSTYETRGLRADGSAFDMEANVSTYHENGTEHTLVILRDITGRKRAEEEIAKRGATLRQIMDTASVGIGLVDKSGRITHANRRLAEMFGRTMEELVGCEYVELVHPSEREIGRKKMLALLSSEVSTVDLERSYCRKDGTQFWGHLACRRFHDVHGNEIGLVGVITDITERKQAEETLRASERKFSAVFGLIPDPTTLTEIETGRIIGLNDAAAQWFGHTREEATGMTTAQVQVWEDPSDRDRMLQAIGSKGEINDMEFRLRMHTGELRDVLFSSRIIELGGKPFLLSRVHDITERTQSESAVKQSEEKYRRLYNETPVLLHSIDRNGVVVEVNDHWLKTMGYARSEVIGRKVTDFYTDASRMLAQGVVQPAFFRDGSVKDISYQFIKKNGDVLDVLLSATAERDAAGMVARSMAVIEDVTERKRAEKALRESEERFKAITMTASDAILLMDDSGKIVYWNPAAGRMFGYSAGEAVGKELHLFLAPERLHENFRKGFRNFVKTGQGPVINTSVELAAQRKDGTEFPIEVSTSAMNIGGRWHALGIIRDISDRKRAEEALRENQARLDLALQSAHMGVWRWEIKENRRYFDDLVCQVLGIDAATFTGTAEEFFQPVHPEDREKIKAALARTIEQDVLYEPAYRVVWQDGSVHYVTARGRLVRDDKRLPVRINGILWDITDQRLLEQELIKTQKLESIGTLAGGIAHDFNNLLQGVFGFISMARLTFDQKEKSLAMLAQAEKALHQSVNLTTQLLTFSKGGKPVKKVLDLRPVIEDWVGFALSGSRITCEIAADEDLHAVEADEGQIGQVIQNIILNADQAMPLGGMIRVSVRNRPAAAIVPQIDLQDNLVEISIRDQGAGIPAEHLTRIFDPYFTTKEKGSGLGLATAYSIIKNHGGLVRVQSEIGKGTTFFIYLPASGASVQEPKSEMMPATTRKGRILVMDDDEMIRAVARELLIEIGHDVAFAESGKTALEAYQAARNAGKPFDVVILDLTIPGGMGGMETLQKLAEIDPGVKAVVSSGYSDDAALSDYRAQGFRAFLKKPYAIEDLKSTLNALLA